MKRTLVGLAVALTASACIINAQYASNDLPVSYSGGDWQTLYLHYDTVPITVTGNDAQGVSGSVQVGGLVRPGSSLEDDANIAAKFDNEKGTLLLNVHTTSKNERLTMGGITLNARRSGAVDLYCGEGNIEVADMTGAVRVGTDSAQFKVKQGTSPTGLPGTVTIDTQIGDGTIETKGAIDVSGHITDLTATIGAGGKVAIGEGTIKLTLLGDDFGELTVSDHPDRHNGKNLDITVPASSGFAASLKTGGSDGRICIQVGTTQNTSAGTTFSGPINAGGKGAKLTVNIAGGPISIHEPGKTCP